MQSRILLCRMVAGIVLSSPLVLFCVNSDAPVTITEQANGSTVAITKGRHIRLELPAQPGTGYAWDIVKLPFQLESIGEPRFDSKVAEGIKSVGNVETQIFIFVAERNG